jgi:hypothetical protein
MQQQYYGVNTHPVMTTIEEENNFLQEINIIPWVAI